MERAILRARGDARARARTLLLLLAATAVTAPALLSALRGDVARLPQRHAEPPVAPAVAPPAFREARELLAALAAPGAPRAAVSAFVAEGRYAGDALLAWLREAPLPPAALDCAAALPLEPAAVAAAAADPARPAEARRSAYHLLARLPGAEARRVLGRALLLEQDPLPALGAVEAAGRTRDPALGPFLRERLAGDPPRPLLAPLFLAAAEVGCLEALPLIEERVREPGAGVAVLLAGLDAARRLDAARGRALAEEVLRAREDLPLALRARLEGATP